MIVNALAPSIAPQQAPLDMFVQWEPSATSQARFFAGLDMETRTVRVMGAGVWRTPDVDHYRVDQGRIVDEARRRFGALKVFFDVREWVVENAQSATQFQDANSQIYAPEDRLAAVVSACVFKQHPRIALSVGQREIFVSMHAAETWLQAYSANDRTA